MNQKILGKLSLKNSIVLLLAISFITISVTSQSSVTAASKPDISKPLELTWYVVGNGRETDTDIVEEEVNKYLKSKINATLKLNTLMWGDDFEYKMATKVISGEEFDITFTSNWAMKYDLYNSYKAFVDITDMMDIYAPKTKAQLGKYLLKGAEIKGRVYAVPTFGVADFKTSGILLNKKLVNKYKIDTSKIKKLSDLEPIFKTIKAKEPKTYDFYPFNTSTYYSIYETLNFEKLVTNTKIPGAIKCDSKSVKVINDYDSTDAKALFSLMRKWYKKGYINNSIPEDAKSDILRYVKNNNLNIFAIYSNLLPTTCQDVLDQYSIDTVAIELTKPTISTGNVTGSMQAISSTSKNPERALMLLELVNTDVRLSNLLNYGIEGVHYKKTGANSIKQLTTRYKDYNPGLKWLFGNESLAYSLPGENPKSWDKVKSISKKAAISPLLGFTFDLKPVSSHLDKQNSIVQKYFNDLIMGKIDPAVNLPKLNKELKNAGMQKVLTEMQKQVDAFKKSGIK